MTREELETLSIGFTKAFNAEDLDAVMSYFAPDAVYNEFNDLEHSGVEAIRRAFGPQFSGKFGKMRFHDEDMFVDPDSGKSLIRWTLTLEEVGRQGAYRGLDILHFVEGKLVEKHTYCKAKVPLIRKKIDLIKEGAWPH
ncbi:MAG: nuclear transport factor 2 family protein [Rhodospirillaceae bacterium]